MHRLLVLTGLAIACKREPAPTTTTTTAEDHDAPAAPSASVAIEDAGVDAPPEPVEEGFFAPGAIGSAIPMARAGAPVVRYGSLNQATCEAELGKRAIAFVRAAPTVGVRAPVRLRGPLHGVAIHSMLPPAQREKSELEIFDCRLVLALDDYTTLLAKHDVVEVIHFSAYRSQKNGGCTPTHPGKQHCAGLALDVGSYVKRDGTTLDVKRDFGGKIGSGTCEPGAHPLKPSPAATELWGFVCTAASRGWFNVILTPNFNQQHENHMHLEVAADAGWMLVH